MPEFADTNQDDTPKEEHKDEWLIRPCKIYKDEYNDCKSIRARFHQYFIFGEIINCQQWKTDYDNCYLWHKYKDEKAYNELINSEKHRIFQRLQNHYNNNVWEKRDKPPENWNAPLPEWLEERNKESYLKYFNEKLKNEQNNK